MIVNVDVTVFYKGYHGDCSEMFLVGEVDQAAKDLVKVQLVDILVAVVSCTISPKNVPIYFEA